MCRSPGGYPARPPQTPAAGARRGLRAGGAGDPPLRPDGAGRERRGGCARTAPPGRPRPAAVTATASRGGTSRGRVPPTLGPARRGRGRPAAGRARKPSAPVPGERDGRRPGRPPGRAPITRTGERRASVGHPAAPVPPRSGTAGRSCGYIAPRIPNRPEGPGGAAVPGPRCGSRSGRPPGEWFPGVCHSGPRAGASRASDRRHVRGSGPPLRTCLSASGPGGASPG